MTCVECGVVLPELYADVLAHLRDEHGLEPERWPDGGLMTYQELEPADFLPRDPYERSVDMS